MRIFGFFLVLVTLIIFVSDAHARSKNALWRWWGMNWQSIDFHPYIGEQHIRQRSLWDGDTWTPEAWIKDAGDEKRIIRSFYDANILTDQFVDGDNIPVLEVGENFIKLSGVDQSRVLQFVDHIFEISSAEENGMFYVFFEQDDDEPLGLYNAYGFQKY